MLKNGNKPVANELQNIELKPVGMQVFNAKLKIKNPRLWHGKNDPFLYTLKTEIFNNGELFDVIIQDVGIRYFEIDEEKGFILNGEPYKLYGVCRHQEWENIGNALLPEHHKTDMELINEIGATSIRLAHYQQDEYIYKLADSMGFLIWAEIPFVNGYKEGADDNALQQMTELIKQNFNHPSIFVWGVHNEVVKGAVVQEPVELTKKLHNLAKNLDPERYTVAVSNIWWVHDHEIHELTDLQGFNQYTGWYGGNPSGLENWIKNYHKKKPDIRTSISEYGAGGNINHQSSDLSPPSPKGKFFAEGYQTYYHEICWAAIEECPHIWASYVWNMFDFSVPEWDRGGIKGRNHKGLITYDRKMKKDAFFWYKANWADSPVLHIAGKRNDTINTSNYIVKAYCNFGAPELIINGKNLGKMQSGINSVQFVSKEIILTKRENKISVKARSGNKMVIEEFIIYVE
jgi:beta-galactosidase